MQLVNEAAAHGKLIVDTLDCIRTVLDRMETRSRLQHMHQATNGLVDWAAAVLVAGRGAAESSAVATMQSALQQCDALICKPCVACGIAQSHDMRLVWDSGCLPPSVCSYSSLQSCTPHQVPRSKHLNCGRLVVMSEITLSILRLCSHLVQCMERMI